MKSLTQRFCSVMNENHSSQKRCVVTARVVRKVRIEEMDINKLVVSLFIIFAAFVGCSKNSPFSPQPFDGRNLIANSTFWAHGVPSLDGWTVPHDTPVQFSNDIPSGGSGSSIILYNLPGPSHPWPYSTIYTTILPPVGLHVYRISILGKLADDIGGELSVDRNRPESAHSWSFALLEILDTNWTSYSHTDTMRIAQADTIFISLTGGSGEYIGRTYLNTCKFEILD